VNENDQRVLSAAEDLQERLRTLPESARGDPLAVYLQNCVDLAKKVIKQGRYYEAALHLEAAAVAIRQADPDRAQPHHLKAQSG
jgi:hypothetical protein